MCYSNPTIINIYWRYRKLVYKIIVNRGGCRITFVGGDDHAASTDDVWRRDKEALLVSVYIG